MKLQQFFFIFLLFVLGACTADTAKIRFGTAQEYSGFIDAVMKRLESADKDMAISFGAGKSDGLKATFINSSSLIKSLSVTIDSLDGFKGDSRFRDAASEYVKFYANAYNNEYKQLVDILLKPELDPADAQKYEQLIDQIETKRQVSRDKFNKARIDFDNAFMKKN